MASSAKGTLDEMIRLYYARCLQVILESRIPALFVSSSSGNWFNLRLGRTSPLLEQLEPWYRDVPKPMVIDILLKQHLKPREKGGLPAGVILPVYKASSVDSRLTENALVLERWVVHFDTCGRDTVLESQAEFLAAYKRTIVVFRTLYSMTRLLPAHRVSCSSNKCNYRILYRLLQSPPALKEVGMTKYCFTPVEGCWGRMCLSVTYRCRVPPEAVPPLLPKMISDYSERIGKLIAYTDSNDMKGEQMACKAGKGFESRHPWPSGDNKVGTKNVDSPSALPADRAEDLNLPFALNKESYRLSGDGSVKSEGVDVGSLIRLFKAAVPLARVQPTACSDEKNLELTDEKQLRKTAGDALQELKLYIQLRDELTSN